jgi:hypothetical protein
MLVGKRQKKNKKMKKTHEKNTDHLSIGSEPFGTVLNSIFFFGEE